jgi:hypothetical protein
MRKHELMELELTFLVVFFFVAVALAVAVAVGLLDTGVMVSGFIVPILSLLGSAFVSISIFHFNFL